MKNTGIGYGNIQALRNVILAGEPKEESPLARRLVEVYNQRLPGCDCARCRDSDLSSADEPKEEREQCLDCGLQCPNDCPMDE